MNYPSRIRRIPVKPRLEFRRLICSFQVTPSLEINESFSINVILSWLFWRIRFRIKRNNNGAFSRK